MANHPRGQFQRIASLLANWEQTPAPELPGAASPKTERPGETPVTTNQVRVDKFVETATLTLR